MGEDVFFDLGCGTGKVVITVALASEVCSSVGLELSETRVMSAVAAIQRADLETRCQAVVENFLTSSRLADATVCFCCNTTLPNGTFAELLERMVKLPNLRLVATLKSPFVESTEEAAALFAASFRGAGALFLETSWLKFTKVH